MAPFEVRTHPNGNATHVTPVGELDLATAPALRLAVDRVVTAGTAGVVLELQELTFIDSTGLRLLLRLYEQSQHDGWELSLTQGPETVRRVFELTATLTVLPFLPAATLDRGSNGAHAGRDRSTS